MEGIDALIKEKHMKNQKNNFLVLVFLTGLAMIAADFIILLFFENTFSQLRFRFGIPSLIFLVLYNIILGMGAKNFNYEYFTKLEQRILITNTLQNWTESNIWYGLKN